MSKLSNSAQKRKPLNLSEAIALADDCVAAVALLNISHYRRRNSASVGPRYGGR